MSVPDVSCPNVAAPVSARHHRSTRNLDGFGDLDFAYALRGSASYGTIVPDSDRAVLEILLHPARDGAFVPDREAQAAVLESRLPPGVHDRAVADRPGTRERAPVDVAALETAEPAEILQRKFGSHREAEPTVLEAQFGVFAEDEALHPVGPGSG